MSSPLIQYIVIRKDLFDVLKWPIGAIVAQGCHSSVAALHKFRNDPNTFQYLDNLNQMRKVVLSIPDKESLLSLSNNLKTSNIDHVLWEEQPENELTAIATRPYVKTDISEHFTGLKCFK